jgi:hypothetical protein
MKIIIDVPIFPDPPPEVGETVKLVELPPHSRITETAGGPLSRRFIIESPDDEVPPRVLFDRFDT